MLHVLLVGTGGCIGSITRFYISVKAHQRYIGTWIANITGSILLAFTFHWYFSGVIDEWLWLLLGVGFCGAYTTFSSFGHETLQLLLSKKYKEAIIYVMSSLIISLIAVATIFYNY